MRLYLVRHGDAVSEHVDFTRPLSQKGVEEVAKSAQYLKDQDVQLALVLQSQKLRAKQTARIIHEALQTPCPIKTEKHLNPNDPLDQILVLIKDLKDDTLIVGHLPFLDRLLSELVGQSRQGGSFSFRTGSAVALERIEGQKYKMIFTVNPHELSP